MKKVQVEVNGESWDIVLSSSFRASTVCFLPSEKSLMISDETPESEVESIGVAKIKQALNDELPAYAVSLN